MRRFILNGHEVLLAKIGGRYHAVSERCTHRGGPLSEGKLEGSNIRCPLHFGEFNFQTGEAITPPASDPLRIYQVSIDAGQVYVELPEF